MCYRNVGWRHSGATSQRATNQTEHDHSKTGLCKSGLPGLYCCLNRFQKQRHLNRLFVFASHEPNVIIMSCTVLQHASLYRRRSQSVKRSWHGMYENDDVSLCSADQAVNANKDKEQRAGSTQKDLAVIAGLCCAPVFPLLNWKWVPAVCHLSFSPFGSVLMLFPYLSITRPSSSLLPRSCLKPSFYLKWNLMLWCVFSEQASI